MARAVKMSVHIIPDCLHQSSWLKRGGLRYHSDYTTRPNELEVVHHHLSSPQVWDLPGDYQSTSSDSR